MTEYLGFELANAPDQTRIVLITTNGDKIVRVIEITPKELEHLNDKIQQL